MRCISIFQLFSKWWRSLSIKHNNNSTHSTLHTHWCNNFELLEEKKKRIISSSKWAPLPLFSSLSNHNTKTTTTTKSVGQNHTLLGLPFQSTFFAQGTTTKNVQQEEPSEKDFFPDLNTPTILRHFIPLHLLINHARITTNDNNTNNPTTKNFNKNLKKWRKCYNSTKKEEEGQYLGDWCRRFHRLPPHGSPPLLSTILRQFLRHYRHWQFQRLLLGRAETYAE